MASLEIVELRASGEAFFETVSTKNQKLMKSERSAKEIKRNKTFDNI